MRLLPRKHVLQYDWLVHLLAAMSLLYPLSFLLSDSDANPWQLTLLYPLFLLQWYRGFWLEGKQIKWAFLFSVLMAVWAMSMHWSGAVFFFYGQMLLLGLTRIWQVSLALLIQALLVVVLAWVWHYPAIFTVFFVLLILLGGHADYLFFKHILAQRDLLMQQEELEYLSRTRERERIARDLHDVLGHTLSTIALKAELSEKLVAGGNPDAARQELNDIAETARSALADVRQTVTGYRSGNLRSELTMAQHALTGAGIETQLPDHLPKNISREIENLMSLVLREAVTNVIRHARSANCRVQFFNRDHCWHLIVADDGMGWNGRYGNGLTGMRERLSIYGGQLRLELNKPGTRLIATIHQVLENRPHDTD